MGFYERDYYRDDGNRFAEAFALRGETTKWLIIINAAVFIVQLITLGDPTRMGRDLGWFTTLFELDTQKVMQGQIWRLLTCAFLHNPETWTHVFFNMWFLWLFGGDIESQYGRREFLAFYLVAAVASSLAYMLEHAFTGPGRAYGASGAVTAVLILCALNFPSRTILLFFFIPVPIWALAVFQVVQDSFGVMSGRGEVAFSAHLGGAAFAFLYYKQQWRVLNWLPNFRSFRMPRARPRLRVYRDEEDKPRQPVSVSAPAPARADVDEQLEAKLDAVLEKVARQGQASLTEGELAILQRASEVYRKRRM